MLSDLPSDIVRTIFETLANEDYESAATLVQVSRTVQSWYAVHDVCIDQTFKHDGPHRIEPILYRSVYFASDDEAHVFDTFYRTCEEQPRLMRLVRTLVIDGSQWTRVRGERLPNLLATTTGLTRLLLWVNSDNPKIREMKHLPTCLTTQSLRHLSGYVETGLPDMKNPLFNSLTHLEIVIFSPLPEPWTALGLLTQLTHFSLLPQYISLSGTAGHSFEGISSIAEQLCPVLPASVSVILLRLRSVRSSMLDLEWILTRCDPRLVFAIWWGPTEVSVSAGDLATMHVSKWFMLHTNGELGLEWGGSSPHAIDYWELAEEKVRRRRDEMKQTAEMRHFLETDVMALANVLRTYSGVSCCPSSSPLHVSRLGLSVDNLLIKPEGNAHYSLDMHVAYHYTYSLCKSDKISMSGYQVRIFNRVSVVDASGLGHFQARCVACERITVLKNFEVSGTFNFLGSNDEFASE
jgi:hypothetical protein